MPDWSIKRLFYGFLAFGSAYLLGGAILDAVGNALAHINWQFTIVGTIAVACVWFALQAALKRYPARFGSYNIKRLTYLPVCCLAGTFLLLWTPPIVNLFYFLRRPEPTPVTTVSKSKEANVVVLVSEFAGINPQSYGVTEIIFEQLTDAVKDYGDVRIKRLREPIDNKEVAYAKGKEELADIVLWGSYLTNEVQTRVTIHFEVMDKTFDVPLSHNKETVNAKTAELESFTIQEKLSKQMTYLVHLTVGIARLDAFDLDGAIKSFTAAVLASPTPTEIIEPHHIYDYRGTCYLLNGQLDKAISDYSQALTFVREPSLLQMRAMAYMSNKQFDNAFEDANEAIRIRGSDECYVLRGFIYSHIKNDEERALSDFEKALALNPANSSALSNRASIRMNQNKWQLAISDLEKILSMDVSNQKQSNAFNSLALIYEENGDVQRALLNYSLAIQANPQNQVPYFNRATFYSKNGYPDQAINDADKAIAMDPEESRNYSVRANALREKGQLDRAIADYTQAISVDPNGPTTFGYYYNRGATYFDKGDMVKAIEDYDRSIKLNPNFSDAYGNRCNAYLNKQEFDRAIADCTKSLTLSNKHANVYSTRGAALASKGLFSQAMSDFNRAIELDPQNSIAHLNLGFAYKDQGQKENAVAEFRKVIQVGRDSRAITAAKRELCALAVEKC